MRNTYLEPQKNYSETPLPQAVAVRAAEFEATHSGAEILTVYHIERNQWQLSYAVNRGTKRHQEFNCNFTAQS